MCSCAWKGFGRSVLDRRDTMVEEFERENWSCYKRHTNCRVAKAPSQFGGVLLASARHAPLAPDKGYNTHDTLSLVYTAA